MNNLGTILSASNKISEEECVYDECIVIAKEIGFKGLEASCLINLGTIAEERGDLQNAEHRYLEALNISKETGHRFTEENALNNLGVFHENQGRLDEAKLCYEECLKMSRDFGLLLSEANSLGNMGRISAKTANSPKDFERAQKLIQESLRIFRQIRNFKGVAITLNNLGNILVVRNDLDGAEKNFLESLDISKKIDDSDSESNASRNLSNLNKIREKDEQGNL